MSHIIADSPTPCGMKTVKCVQCGTVFRRNSRNPKFCSDACCRDYRRDPASPKRRWVRKPVPEDRRVRVSGELAHIPLTRGFVAVIDAADAHLVEGHTWRCISSAGHNYAARSVKHKDHVEIIYLHRLLTDAPAGMTVDHRDNDGLNNRRKNLRLATTSQNGMNAGPQKNNTTGFKGVSLVVRNGKYAAVIIADRKHYNLGHFPTPQEAHAAYQGAAKVLHGKFARFK